MDRLQVSGWTPAEVAERISDVGAEPSVDVDALMELITNPASLKDLLEDEELAKPLAEMVEMLPRCGKELTEQRTPLPELTALLARVAHVERILFAYAKGDC